MQSNIETLKSELSRCIGALADHDPGSEAYSRLTDQAHSVFGLVERFDYLATRATRTEVGGDPNVCYPSPAEVAHENAVALIEPEPEPEPAEEKGDAPKVDNDYFEALRGRLTYARNERGVDTRELLGSVGASNYSSLKGDGARLLALEAALNAKLAELEKK